MADTNPKIALVTGAARRIGRAIAERLGVSVNTVKARLRRGLDKLRAAKFPVTIK